MFWSDQLDDRQCISTLAEKSMDDCENNKERSPEVVTTRMGSKPKTSLS
ncbi:MAG: hypothetical protein IPK94_05910 [Saprospiraceae bacterium]|nr:hypothetical protein [Saprospiraceae bacterium]